jgi:ATP sulfurylase
MGSSLTLCLNEEDFNKVLSVNRLRHGYKWIRPNTVALTHVIYDEDIGMVVIVALNPSKDTLKDISTLIHEAVHVYQANMDCMAEDDPGREIEAYSIETISGLLINDYLRQMGKKIK